MLAVELSVSMGVPDWGCLCPISSSAVRIGTASCALRNKLPISASAAEAATVRSVLHRTWMAPFGSGRGGEVVALGKFVRKKCPAARLRALGKTR